MDEQEMMKVITLIDDEGNEHEFELLADLEVEEGVFYALLPIDEEDEMLDADTYYIFELINENGEEQLAEVEDEALLDKLAEIFESRFDELFESEDGLEN